MSQIRCLTKLLQERKSHMDPIEILIDNDIIFTDDGKFSMDPNDALFEALALLGFDAEYV